MKKSINKRPNIEDYKLVDGGYSQKYITDLEKYCNYLEDTIKYNSYTIECLKDDIEYLQEKLSNYISFKYKL